ncbi:MAG TPA: twin-arginine translocation signal domain-containing protein [Gemmataceae bacterium]|nr:twin-arginine translocation signal domain-containing protein [Gemmataceae bacterium]
MDDTTRRDALKLAAAVGVVAAVGAATTATADEIPKPAQTDRDRVIAAGLTEAEADCWEVTAQAAGKFFALPELHPSDKHEVAQAIHIIQHKLLSRPTYRKYLELSKAAAGKK